MTHTNIIAYEVNLYEKHEQFVQTVRQRTTANLRSLWETSIWLWTGAWTERDKNSLGPCYECCALL